MTKNDLLDALKAFTEDKLKNMLLPVQVQKNDIQPEFRAPEVFKMRLPDVKTATKKAPYVIHQIITGKDSQAEGEMPTSTATVRSIMCVYNEDEQEGALMLLELAERLKAEFMRSVVIADQFRLDLQEGIEQLFYPDDTAPYYAGEMVTTWELPAVEREVIL